MKTETLSAEEIKGYLDYYEGKGYIKVVDNSGTKKGMAERILPEMQSALDVFLSEIGLPKVFLRIEEVGGNVYISGQSLPIPKHTLGIFSMAMREVRVSTFGGMEVQWSDKTGEEYWNPLLWTSLNLSYAHVGGGTNGAELGLHTDKWGKRSGRILYDARENQFKFTA